MWPVLPILIFSPYAGDAGITPDCGSVRRIPVATKGGYAAFVLIRASASWVRRASVSFSSWRV